MNTRYYEWLQATLSELADDPLAMGTRMKIPYPLALHIARAYKQVAA